CRWDSYSPSEVPSRIVSQGTRNSCSRFARSLGAVFACSVRYGALINCPVKAIQFEIRKTVAIRQPGDLDALEFIRVVHLNGPGYRAIDKLITTTNSFLSSLRIRVTIFALSEFFSHVTPSVRKAGYCFRNAINSR